MAEQPSLHHAHASTSTAGPAAGRWHRPPGGARRSPAASRRGQRCRRGVATAPSPSCRTPRRGRRHLRRQRHHGARGPRGGPQAARHVHRLDRRARPAPPGLRGRRQLRRRGAGRLLRHRSTSRCSPTAASASSTTAAASRSTSHPTEGVPRRRGRADRAARRRQVRRRRLQGLRRSARRRRLGRQRAVRAGSTSRSARRATSGAQAYRARRARRRRWPQARARATRPARRSPSGPSADDLRDHRLRLRDAARPVPADGVPQQGPDDHPRSTSAPTTPTRTARRPRGHLPVRRRPRRLRRAPQRLARRPRRNPEVIDFEAEDAERRMSVEVAMQWNTAYTESVHTFANTINTHEGGTHEEGFRAALTTLVNKLAREEGHAQGEATTNLSGDDIREGLTAIISIKLGEPQFEGQTKTKLGNTEAKTLRAAGRQRAARRLVRAEPARGQRHRPQGDPGRGAARIAARKARDLAAAARACSAAAACPASCPTASRPTRTSARSSSSRATRPAARPRAAATRGSRRSCRSAARSSTSRRPASTRCCRTTRCRR